MANDPELVTERLGRGLVEEWEFLMICQSWPPLDVDYNHTSILLELKKATIFSLHCIICLLALLYTI